MTSSDSFSLRHLNLDALRKKRSGKWAYPATKYSAWVADMDFPIAPAISQHLQTLLDHDELGYPAWLMGAPRSPAAVMFAGRMAVKFGWEPDLDGIFDMSDVLQGVQLSIALLSEPGDGVVLHMPAYYPFLETCAAMDRPIIPVNATRTDNGYRFDYDELEARLAKESASVWVLCHPHNPLGHVFDPQELERIAAIAERHNLYVISDEIHADLVYAPHGHVPFAVVNPTTAGRTMTVSSASKAFNLAGLRWGVLHAGVEAAADRIRSLPNHYLGAPNTMGVEATCAAWSKGDEWLKAVMEVLDENRRALVGLLDEHLPGAVYRVPEATYLAWVDVGGCDLDGDPYVVFRNRGVEVSDGSTFGGDGHVRINFATSPDILAATIAAMGASG